MEISLCKSLRNTRKGARSVDNGRPLNYKIVSGWISNIGPGWKIIDAKMTGPEVRARINQSGRSSKLMTKVLRVTQTLAADEVFG